MSRLLQTIILALCAVLFAACSTTSPSKASSPEILSRTVVAGKGIPNGRSDSGMPFTKVASASNDSTYGYSPKNPIKVVTVTGDPKQGSLASRLYLNALRDSNGQPIEYERRGSCCQFATPNGVMGGGLLDVYDIKIDGVKVPVVLYVNMYDPGALVAPIGFTPRSQ
jgi:hypothetical protein